MTGASETWDTDIAAAMGASAFTARDAVDMTDPAFITAARARGPVPESVDGVEISETTLPASDGHQVTVRLPEPDGGPHRPVELHLLPGVPHAFDGIAPQGRMTRTAYDLMCAAVDRAVG